MRCEIGFDSPTRGRYIWPGRVFKITAFVGIVNSLRNTIRELSAAFPVAKRPDWREPGMEFWYGERDDDGHRVMELNVRDGVLNLWTREPVPKPSPGYGLPEFLYGIPLVVEYTQPCPPNMNMEPIIVKPIGIHKPDDEPKPLIVGESE